jgi:hypothetical protein
MTDVMESGGTENSLLLDSYPSPSFGSTSFGIDSERRTPVSSRSIPRHSKDPTPSIFEATPPPCPTPKGYWSIDRSTGEMTFHTYAGGWDHHGNPYPMRCGKNVCESCVIYNARRVAGAIKLAAPTHALCITLVGRDRSEINRTASRFAAVVRTQVSTFRWAWAVEGNPEHTGCHIHAYFHTGIAGLPVSKGTLHTASVRAGMGTELRVDEVRPNSVASYFGYPMKSLADPNMRDGFLELNGSPSRLRLIHASRTGFWRNSQGEVVTREVAEREAYRLSRARAQ